MSPACMPGEPVITQRQHRGADHAPRERIFEHRLHQTAPCRSLLRIARMLAEEYANDVPEARDLVV